ncbi:MAG: hypothetical protein ABGZ53_05140 [Fuerstiella sp.]|jgi:hypothetical protein|nr:hypothetical protein [Fuerstiella sp.]
MATSIVIRNRENNPIPGIVAPAMGVLTCVIVGYVANLVMSGHNPSPANLTVYTLKKETAADE